MSHGGEGCIGRRRHLAIGGIVLAVAAGARAQSLPDTVAPPKAVNLGSTSFFDGFGRTDEGWSWLQYGKYEDLDRITDWQGHKSPYFSGTSIQVFSELTQLVYASGLQPFGGDAISFTMGVPLIGFSSHFASDSPVKLANNGVGIGDFVWGPGYQSRLYKRDGKPVLSFRLQLLIMSPTGDFNKRDGINQSAGFWGVNPYVSLTVLPDARLEFSTRLNYQYNFRTSAIADPPPIPGLTYTSGQAGQIVYGNVDASYEVAAKIRLGFNGYFLQSLTPDRTDNRTVPHSEVSAVSAGPGGRYTFDGGNALNANAYFPVVSRNGSPGPQFNLQFVHRF
jgi:hypothetical protein